MSIPALFQLIGKKIRDHKQRVFVFIIVIFGLVTILITKAAVNVASIEPETGSKSPNIQSVTDGNASKGGAIKFGAGSGSSGDCGKRVTNYSYQVPFGNAAWNIPACDLPLHPQSNKLASNFFKYANGIGTSPEAINSRGLVRIKFGLETDLNASFGRSIFYGSEANIEKRVQSYKYSSNLDGYPQTKLPDATIPWNNSWQVANAGDNEVVIIEDRAGPNKNKIYELAGINTDTQALTCFPWDSNRICAAHVRVVEDPLELEPVNYLTYEGSSKSRGVGIPMFAGMVTPAEVSAGEIRHAIGVGLFNTSFGPECTQTQINNGEEGDLCGTAVAPASKFEWASGSRGGPWTGLRHDQTLPEGTRIRINVDDNYIDNFISQNGYTGQKARTARIFARAMVDYGIIIVDTGGVTQMQVAAGINPSTRAGWAENGITSSADDKLLSGLINESTDIQVLATPINKCIDGVDSKYYCQYLTSTYEP